MRSSKFSIYNNLQKLIMLRFIIKTIPSSLSALSNSFPFSSQNQHSFNQIMIVRTGQTIWNKENRWVGWSDVPLSTDGIKQAKQCAKLVKNSRFKFDEVYTSVLTRAIKTTNYILDELDCMYLPVHKHWRLNEKHYGALQGEIKVQINQKYGEQLVTEWRRSFDSPPPRVDIHDNRHPVKDRRYKFIKKQYLPNTQSVSDIIDRLKPLYNAEIKNKLLNKKKLLIVAHGSSLRALISIMNPSMTHQQVKNFNIPSAIPIIMSMNSQLVTEKFEYIGDESEIVYRMEKLKNETKKTVNVQ